MTEFLLVFEPADELLLVTLLDSEDRLKKRNEEKVSIRLMKLHLFKKSVGGNIADIPSAN
jgi:hypothetical protein